MLPRGLSISTPTEGNGIDPRFSGIGGCFNQKPCPLPYHSTLLSGTPLMSYSWQCHNGAFAVGVGKRKTARGGDFTSLL